MFVRVSSSNVKSSTSTVFYCTIAGLSTAVRHHPLGDDTQRPTQETKSDKEVVFFAQKVLFQAGRWHLDVK